MDDYIDKLNRAKDVIGSIDYIQSTMPTFAIRQVEVENPNREILEELKKERENNKRFREESAVQSAKMHRQSIISSVTCTILGAILGYILGTLT